MTTVNIRGIPVSFPFKPYEIQKDYMEKVIECLQTDSNGVLESPTGTGKTLSLLCSSLAWLMVQKAKYQAEMRLPDFRTNFFPNPEDENESGPSQINTPWGGVPTIIYASRTHSQLTQAMQELKRTSYSHVRSTIIGSRDQLCIHPDVVKETSNSVKINMCQGMVKARSCHLYNRVEKMTSDPSIAEMNIADIEDLVNLAQKRKFCPYYMTRELKKSADIIFMPYNYLLDPKARRANKIELKNSVIILDEAHNVEKVCEESASFQLKTTDITLCIEEVTEVMKFVEKGGLLNFDSDDSPSDFDKEQLANFKEALLLLEKAIDNIKINITEGTTFEGTYIFEIFGQAGINDDSHNQLIGMLDKLIQFLNTAQKENPFHRSGSGLQHFQDLLVIIFQDTSQTFKEKLKKCFKVHITVEEDRKQKATADTWLSKNTKSMCRVLNFWCFSPNFGMQMLMELGIKSVILTSGTLAPLKPLISELGIEVKVRLENPHVVDINQICVKILSTGPDGTPLNSGYQNRDNQKYISSLGMAIANISRQIPNGLLVFFPSYALLAKCQESWQRSGIWASMNQLKTVYVEPRTKDAFTTIMHEFYEKIKSPNSSGATFMAVCRGKVSEGMDFADMNGRAVIITGLPYPPFKDPRVVLKKKYLDLCRTKDSQLISGQDWYGLEATRAVNQAIGRVIRHRYDYGAILLLDSRFNNVYVKNQLSLWIRDHVQAAKGFGEVIRDMKRFFQNASQYDNLRIKQSVPLATSSLAQKENIEYGEVKIYDLTTDSPTKEKIKDDKKSQKPIQNEPKRRKLNTKIIVQSNYNENTSEGVAKDIKEFAAMMKKNLDDQTYRSVINALTNYNISKDFDEFIRNINEIFSAKPHLKYLIQGMMPFVQSVHKERFNNYWDSVK